MAVVAVDGDELVVVGAAEQGPRRAVAAAVGRSDGAVRTCDDLGLLATGQAFQPSEYKCHDGRLYGVLWRGYSGGRVGACTVG